MKYYLLPILLFTFNTFASIIEIDSEADLTNANINQCIPASSSSNGQSLSCFKSTPFLIGAPIPTINVNTGDTVRVNVNFADNQRLRWNDDGGLFFGGREDEILRLQLSSTTDIGPNRVDIFVNSFRLSFHDISGFFTPNGPTEGNILLLSSNVAFTSSFVTGLTSFTDSFFEFSGFTVELGIEAITEFIPNTFSSVNNPPARDYTVDGLLFRLTSGNFEIRETIDVNEVPEPSALFLLVLGILGFIIQQARKVRSSAHIQQSRLSLR